MAEERVLWTDIIRMEEFLLSQPEIMRCIQDGAWQTLRVSLKGTTTTFKLHKLEYWLQINQYDRDAKVQVMNYINALKRGGQLDRDGYVQR